MARSRDLFANFDRMRREIDELFGDVFERATGLRGGGFSPPVDVYYVDDPPRAVVKADLAGIHLQDIALEIRGRQLLIAGERRPAEAAGPALPADRDRARPVPAPRGAGRRGGGRRGQARATRTGCSRWRSRWRPPNPVRRGADRRGRAGVSIHIPSVDGEAAQAIVQTSLPEELPVLPLRETRALPRDAHAARHRPGALDGARERRARRQPDARDGGEQGPRRPGARPRRRLPRGRGRSGVAHAQGARRDAPDPRARRAAGRVKEFVRTEPYMVARIEEARDEIEPSPELEALHRNVQTTFSRIIEEVPYLPEELQIAVTNLDDPSELAHMIAGALRIKTEEKQALLEERNVARRLRMLSELLARELELVEIGTRIQSQVQSEMDKGQREYWLRQQLKAIQEELGEVDEARGRGRGAPPSSSTRPSLPGARPQAGRPRAPALRAAAPAVGGARADPDLPRVAGHAALVAVQRGHARPEGRAQAARPGPLRHRGGEGPHPRVPRGPQAEAGRALVDPLLRRAARRGEDLARPLGRRHARALLRAHLGGRRARRVRDPRPPPHLHRGDARHDPPRDARRRDRATRC